MVFELAHSEPYKATQSKGVVVDESGNPVIGTKVTLGVDLDSKVVELQPYALPVFETDADGHFVVANVAVITANCS